MGLYVNDKWKLDNHWAFQIGFRFDNYKAQSTDSKQTAGASGFSPRLGATYDVFGDQKLVLKASYCLYNAAVLEAITGSVSSAENIGIRQYLYTGPGGRNASNFQPASVVFDVNNYTRFNGSADPTVNIFIDPDMKAPTCTEIQAGAAYSLFTEKYGQGFFSATFVYRDWSNMIDYSMGNNPINTVPDPDGPSYPPLYTEYWTNEPMAKRTYTGGERVADWTWKKLHVGANVTLSTLEGNYEGEGDSTPASGQGLSYFRELKYKNAEGNEVVETLYDTNKLAPVGYLAGHTPVVANVMADWSFENRWGRTALGYIFSYESGETFSHMRTVPSAAYHELLEETDYGPDSYEYKDDKRTHGTFNASMYHDLAITHDLNVIKVANYKLRIFAKAIITNVFNHQQQLTWNEPAFKEVTQADLDAAGGDLSKVKWEEELNTSILPEASRRGTFTNANFGSPRGINISVGLRF
jgi:hypothetical protein